MAPAICRAVSRPALVWRTGSSSPLITKVGTVIVDSGGHFSVRPFSAVASGSVVRVPKQVDHEQRRRALADAVFSVISVKGYDAVTLRDVAAHAGVSLGSVQHYFASKDEMLLFALNHMRVRVQDRLQAAIHQCAAAAAGDIVEGIDPDHEAVALYLLTQDWSAPS